MTKDELTYKFPRASNDFIRANSDSNEASRAVVECGAEHAPLQAPQVKASHSGKFTVSIVSYRRRLLDEDNLCEKFFCDGLRYAGCLPSDAPDKATISVSQIKVKTKEEERTVITVTPPQDSK